jgi:hypothetical protein
MRSVERIDLTVSATRRHHLDSPLAAGPASLLEVADATVGLHSTLPGTPYLSLNARIDGFDMDDLDREVYDHRALVRLKVMRGTLFLLTHELAQIAFAATMAVSLDRDRKWLGIDPSAYRRLAPLVLDVLGQRSLTAAELRGEVGPDDDLTAVVSLLCDEARIVRDRPTGGRTSTRYRYRRWEETFPELNLRAYDRERATDELVRRYVTSYGPVSVRDVVWWTGLSVKRIRASLDRLGDELEALGDPRTGERWLRIGGTDGDAAPRRGTPRVRLLPRLDPYTMGYRDRARLVDVGHEGLVYDRGGNATSVVLQDGRIAGVWDLTDSPTPTGRLMLFDPASPARRRALDLVAETGEFWFGRSIPVREYTQMVPLKQRTGVMRKPLDGATPGR